MNSSQWSIITVLLIFLLHLPSCISSSDSISPNQTIKDGDVLVSSRSRFALGFFTPGNYSDKRFVGVWYNKVPEQTIVWVANRDNPVNDTSGVLVIHEDGGLVIYGKEKEVPIWSANVTLSSPNNSIAKLLDTGNLVLLESESSRMVLWQGFDYPSDTLLPSMKIGLNRRTGRNRSLTSWKSKDDPGTGNTTFGLDTRGFPELVLFKSGNLVWRGGPWIGDRWGIPPGVAADFVNNGEEISYMYTAPDESTLARGVIDESGIYRRLLWSDQQNQWIDFSNFPNEWCDNYGQCGQNSICDPYNPKLACNCLPGFEPKSPRDWNFRVKEEGCIRKAGAPTPMCRNGDWFVKVAHVKVPDTSTAHMNKSLSLKDCEMKCLMNCSCTAFSSTYEQGGGSRCVTWHGEMMDTRTYFTDGQDLHVRVDAATLAQYTKSGGSLGKKARLAIALGGPVTVFLILLTIYWFARMKIKGKERRDLFSYGDPDDGELKPDLPFFDISTISAATKSFCNENRLGEGGFGPVYKGVLSSGTEIAVKRLSRNSGQGNEEFKNEVVLIARLQHRNLVRILGYCVQDEEKMLIYEYLPNKSLDYFIFNETKRALLDWTKRLEIIFGIARGILYLHQDSRLRIIHRDLKASNVLLDYDMNPKIADFGMARIFGANQIEANTNRVVGTYGYMSPEYAMEGLFSVKSDVYSFGVLLLEIVTGRKNTGHYHDNPDSNLVGHVWDLWKEGRALEIIDTSLGESYPESEVLRCIQIGLLCVQEFTKDRPTMSTVVSMLGNDAALPSPRKPGFLLRGSPCTSGDPSTSTGDANYSINYVTCSIVEAR